MSMNKLAKLASVGTALMVLPTAALAQTAGATPSLTPISDAVTSGVSQGITVLLAIAPIVIAFTVVWGVINKSRSMAK
jgi:VIT1/CCC1 family predicted Fe2+/Mn2+ transporter